MSSTWIPTADWSRDNHCELTAFRGPDGDPYIQIRDGKETKTVRFAIGSQPFEHTEIYLAAARLADAFGKQTL